MEENQSLAKLKIKHLGQDLVDALTEPTPKEYILNRPVGGGKNADYVPGHYFIERLNDCFGFLWSLRYMNEKVEDTGAEGKKQVVLKCEMDVIFPGITREVRHPDGTIEITKVDTIKITKSQYGGSEVKTYANDSGNYKKGDCIDLANDYKSAGTDAMKKAATEFGIFLDVYGSREVAAEDIKKISSSQLQAFYLRSDAAGMTADEADKWCQDKFKVLPKDLSPMTFSSGALPQLLELGKKKKETT